MKRERMMRALAKSLAALAGVIWAGTATAASLSVVDQAGPYSSVVYAPSDLVTVDVLLDGSGLPLSGEIASMFFHVNWSANLSLVSRTYATGLPGVFWSTLAGHGTVDANGLYTAQYDVTDEGGVFPPDTLIVTMVFHVIEPGPAGQAVITPVFATGDAIGGGVRDAFPVFTYEFDLNSATIHTPEPASGLLLGLGLLGVAYTARRRIA